MAFEDEYPAPPTPPDPGPAREFIAEVASRIAELIAVGSADASDEARGLAKGLAKWVVEGSSSTDSTKQETR